MSIKVGDDLPSVDLFEGTPNDKVNTSDFKKGKIVIFGVPGAFTPTCSKSHVPSFLESYDAIIKNGVSSIICLSVNDPFVMTAWGKTMDPEGRLRFLADTNAAFSKACGLTIDLTGPLGGVRCKRFAMVVMNGKVKGINVEPDGTGQTCSAAVDIIKLLQL